LIWIGFAHAGRRVIHVVHRFPVADERVADEGILEQAVFAQTLAGQPLVPGRQEPVIALQVVAF